VLYLAAALLSHQVSIFFLQTPAYAGTIALGALSAFTNACALCLVLIVRLTEQHKLYLRVQLPTLMLQVGLIVTLFLTASLNVTSQYIATACTGLFATTIYAVVLRYWLSGRIDRQKFVKASRIGAQMLPWQIATLLATNSAAFFLTRAGHLDEAGLFLVASAAAGLILTASASFTNVWTPFVLLRKDQPDLAQTQVRIFTLYSSTLLMVASALSLFSHELFMVLAGPKFREGYHLVPALSLAYCIFCFAESFAQGLQARQRTIHYAWVGIAASTVFLLIAFPLAKIWGARGIIAAMSGSFFAMLVLLQVASARFMPVAYPWIRHGLMWILAAGIIAYAFPLPVTWPGVATKLIALASIASLPFLFGTVRGSDLRLAVNALYGAMR
jgi:O-antigen/teichoic acid export membrane protein